MIANHIHDALGQVKKLQEVILEKRQFKGYSGTARIICGITALAGAAVLASDYVADTPVNHLKGWFVVLIIGLLINYSSLIYWFLFDVRVRRNVVMVKPAVDAIPALAVGAVLTLAAIISEQFDLLFGIWMCLYGLAQTAYRLSLPRGIYLVGIGYIICGAYCILPEPASFTDPWPMGLVFFAGEMIGGKILLEDHLNDE